jgi:uncharacterized membrane protein
LSCTIEDYRMDLADNMNEEENKLKMRALIYNINRVLTVVLSVIFFFASNTADKYLAAIIIVTSAIVFKYIKYLYSTTYAIYHVEKNNGTKDDFELNSFKKRMIFRIIIIDIRAVIYFLVFCFATSYTRNYSAIVTIIACAIVGIIYLVDYIACKKLGTETF